MKTLASDIIERTQALNSDSRRAYLVRIELDTSDSLNYTTYPIPIRLGSDDYQPHHIDLEALIESSSPDSNDAVIKLGNYDRALSLLVVNKELSGKRITIFSADIRPQNGLPDVVKILSKDTLKILNSEIASDGFMVALTVGNENRYASQIPKNRWNDKICEWVFRATDTCHYGKDEFLGQTQGDLKFGGDGTKWAAWRMKNSANASEVAINPASALGHLKIVIPVGTTPDWSGSLKTAPWVYRVFPAAGTAADGATIADPDVEIKVTPHGGFGIPNENNESIGLLISTDSDTPSEWVHFFLYHNGSGVRIAAKSGAGGTESDLLTATVSTHRLLRIRKDGTTFRIYTREKDTDTYGAQLASVVNANLTGPFRVGIIAEANNGSRDSDWAAVVDHFRLLAGGYTTCFNTLTACRARENTIRFGGAAGILHGPVVF